MATAVKKTEPRDTRPTPAFRQPHGGTDPDGFRTPKKPDYFLDGQPQFYNRNIDIYEVHVNNQYYATVYVTCGAEISDVEARAKAIYRHLKRYPAAAVEYKFINSITPDEGYNKRKVKERQNTTQRLHELRDKIEAAQRKRAEMEEAEAEAAATAPDIITDRPPYDHLNTSIVPSFTLVRHIDGYSETYDTPAKVHKRLGIQRKELFEVANRNRLTLFSTNERRNTHTVYKRRQERYIFYTEDMYHVEHLGIFHQLRRDKPSADKIQIALIQEKLDINRRHEENKQRCKRMRQQQRESAKHARECKAAQHAAEPTQDPTE